MLNVDTKAVLAFTHIQFVAGQVGFVTGDSDWRHFGCAAANSLRQPDTVSALENLINFLVYNAVSEDKGQWGVLADGAAKVQGAGHSAEEKLKGLCDAFRSLATGAHNVDQWGSIRNIADFAAP